MSTTNTGPNNGMDELKRSLNIINQAINIATKSGCFNADEAFLIKTSYNNLDSVVKQLDSKMPLPKPKPTFTNKLSEPVSDSLPDDLSETLRRADARLKAAKNKNVEKKVRFPVSSEEALNEEEEQENN